MGLKEERQKNMDPLRCIEWVYSSDGWDRGHQCSYARKVGDKCGVHDPAAVQKRRAKSDARYKQTMAEMRHSVDAPRRKVLDALQPSVEALRAAAVTGTADGVWHRAVELLQVYDHERGKA